MKRKAKSMELLSIRKLLADHPDLRNLNPDGLPSIGKPQSADCFSADLLPLKNMFDIYGDSAGLIVKDRKSVV